jgi:hypothetical protein
VVVLATENPRAGGSIAPVTTISLKMSVLAFVVLLAGCVGYEQPGHDLTITCNVPGPELSSRGWIAMGCERIPEPTYTKDEVSKRWGPPDKTYVANGLDHWEYNDEQYWSGTILYFVVPIPLAIPRLNYRADLTFAGDNLKVIHIRRGTRNSSMCGLLARPKYVPFYPGCRSYDGSNDRPRNGWIIQDRSDT